MGCEILLVEDDVDIREALIDALQDDGWVIVGTANGVEALAYLATGARPCVILLDLHMPVMDGATFRARQQQDPHLADIPVAVFSADPRRELDASFDGVRVVPKPVDLDSLLEALRDYCP